MSPAPDFLCLGPHVTITLVLVHGVGAFFYTCDEGMTLGANWTLEIAARPHSGQ